MLEGNEIVCVEEAAMSGAKRWRLVVPYLIELFLWLTGVPLLPVVPGTSVSMLGTFYPTGYLKNCIYLV
jgi:hypothetical protein